MSHYYEHGIGVRILMRFLGALSKLDVEELDLSHVLHSKMKKAVYRYGAAYE